jgi:hypothetical protein
MAGFGQQRPQDASLGFVQLIFVRPNAKPHKELLDELCPRVVLEIPISHEVLGSGVLNGDCLLLDLIHADCCTRRRCKSWAMR